MAWFWDPRLLVTLNNAYALKFATKPRMNIAKNVEIWDSNIESNMWTISNSLNANEIKFQATRTILLWYHLLGNKFNEKYGMLNEMTYKQNTTI